MSDVLNFAAFYAAPILIVLAACVALAFAGREAKVFGTVVLASSVMAAIRVSSTPSLVPAGI